MKKKHRVLKGIIIGVVIAAVATCGVLYATGVFEGSKEASSTTYKVSKLTTGDLEESVKGTGALAAGGTSEVTSPVAFTIDTVKVEAAESVKKGDVLATVDTESLDATIESLQSSIKSSDSQLAQLLKSEDSTTKLKSNMKGRVKKIMVKAGSDVKSAMEQYGGLMILSIDEKMRLDITLPSADSVKLGDEVTVKTGGKKYDGLVENVSDDKKEATVTLTDSGPALDADATVYSDGKKIGSGKLKVNQPVLVTATSGTVKKVRAYLNKKVHANSTLLYLENVPYSQSYLSAAEQRAEYAEQLKEALLIKKTGAILAPEDGIVESVAATDGKAVAVDEVLLNMYTGGASSLDVSVDELDISKVAAGQKVSIAMDAISDKTYSGEVISVSEVGATSNGVTTYPVGIKVSDGESLKIGMSATATIIIEQHTGVLLLPIDALQTSQGKQYVWVYTGSLPKDGTGDPGKRTEVKVGLSNDNYVEIVSGLTADDQVVIVRTRSTSSSSNSSNRNNQNRMEFGGMPQGGFQGAPPGRD